MPYKRIKGFKGVQEYIDFAELPENYAQELQNLDVDNTLGRLTLRKGYSKKYNDNFTSIISAHEFTVEDNGDVILILNDNGTFKYYKNGTLVGSLSLPSGSAVDSTFTNNYFAWRNSVRITTGAGETNHVLWFGRTEKKSADNDGLFGNALNDTGTYRLLRSQLIPKGVFSQVSRVVKMSTGTPAVTRYYMTHHNANRSSTTADNQTNSAYITILDEEFRYLRRVDPLQNSDTYNAFDTETPNLSIATDDTYIYCCGYVDASTLVVLKLDPDSFEVVAENTVTTGTGSGCLTDIAVNSSNVYVVKSNYLYELSNSDLSTSSSTGTSMSNCYAVECDDTYVWTGSGRQVQIRTIGTLGTVDASSSNLGDSGGDYIYDLHYLSGLSTIWATCYDTSNFVFHDDIYELADTALTTTNTHSYVPEARCFILDSSNNLNAISDKYGITQDVNSQNTYEPYLFGLRVSQDSNGDSQIGTGTHFYKVSAVDVDGQEFPLSDPVVVNYDDSVATFDNIKIRLVCMEAEVAYFYRVKSLRLYRAYNSGSVNEKDEATKYRLLEEVDINDFGWQYDSTNDVYYYDYIDKTSESEISSTTFEESAGFSDQTKPRYVNAKYLTWQNDRLHAANLYYVGDRAYASTIVRSPVYQPDNLPFFDVYHYRQDGGDEIVGLLPSYGRVVAFKERRTGVFYNTQLENEYSPGVSSDKGYVKHNDSIFYCNERGLYYLDGNTHRRVNDPVQRTYGNISDYTDGVMFFFDDKDRLITSFAGEESFIWNMRYDVWTIYDSAFSFKGYFKNSDNEYIGFSGTNFYKLFEDADDDGTDISNVVYESPLIPLENADGFDNELLQVQMRHLLDEGTGSPVVEMKIYNYRGSGSGKVLEKTVTIDEFGVPPYTYPTNKTFFINDVWGEAFSIRIEAAEVRSFEINSFTLKYNVIGESVNG